MSPGYETSPPPAVLLDGVVYAQPNPRFGLRYQNLPDLLDRVKDVRGELPPDLVQ
jgi:hypothetical protein